MTRLIDLRSDTVTKPSEAMRAAMAAAEVGDDWYGDDPTVNRLQEAAAAAVGTEDALYVATGTMGNQIAMHAQTRAGHFVVAERDSHVATTEVSTSAILSAIAFRGLPSTDGSLTPDQVREALEPDPFDVEIVDLLSLENTHQAAGGVPWGVDEFRAVTGLARERGVSVHLDGARLFNACAATGATAADYTSNVDTVMFCLSKGLGAPIGSMVCGTKDFIREAKRTRILIGGAWRQAGIMAAAGLIALRDGPGRLHQDHANAKRLAEGIAESTPGAIDPATVQTNILYLDTQPIGITGLEVRDRLRDAGVLSNALGTKVRLVTNLDVSAQDVEDAITVWRKVAEDARSGSR
jgi:threonine aldolase